MSLANIPPDRSEELHRAIVLVQDSGVAGWVGSELVGVNISLRVSMSTVEVVRALIDDPPPRPQVLIVDIDALGPSDVAQLHAVRDGGWFGSIVALGEVPLPLRESLRIAQVLGRPRTGGALRAAIKRIGLDRVTTKVSKLQHHPRR